MRGVIHRAWVTGKSVTDRGVVHFCIQQFNMHMEELTFHWTHPNYITLAI